MEENIIIQHFTSIEDIWDNIKTWLAQEENRYDNLNGIYKSAKENWEQNPIQIMLLALDSKRHVLFLGAQNIPEYGFTFGCTPHQEQDREPLLKAIYSYMKEHRLSPLIMRAEGEIESISILVRLFNEDRNKDLFKVEANEMKYTLLEVNKETKENKPPGKLRMATAEDYTILIKMKEGFDSDVFGDDGNNEEENKRRALRINTLIKDQAIFLWEIIDDKGIQILTAMIGISRQTHSGGTIGPVYTFPEHRRKGYATAGVAELCQYCLSTLNKKFITLKTDLDNPTSNSVYTKVGFFPEKKWVTYNININK